MWKDTFKGIVIGIFIATMALTLGECAHSVEAADVTLEWDANTEPNLAGYRIFCREKGEEYNYACPDWDGIETQATITDLADDVVYYFVARAYSIEAYESGDSNEVCWDGTSRKIPDEPEPEEELEEEPEEEPEEKSKSGNSKKGCFINIIRR